MITTAGIIGYGTVGAVLSQIFKKAGITCCVYDALMEDPEHEKALAAKAAANGAVVTDPETLIQRNSLIISTVTTQVAGKVAQDCLPYLNNKHIYLDFNSTSPGVKVKLKEIVESGGARFVEGVILNAVHEGDTTMTVLTGGGEGKQIAGFLSDCNLKARFFSGQVGKASMFKMLRSIFSKGVEVLLLEMLMAAQKAGMEKDLWNEIVAFMDSKSFREIGENWVKTHATACNRRMHEMNQVIATMDELGVRPVLSAATLQSFEQSVSLGLNSFYSETPTDYEQVISRLAEQIELQTK